MNYPPLSKLRSFVAIATSGSFRKASERLNLSPQALSAHIRDLEDQFRLPLFHRTTRSVRLTQDGERFLMRVRRAIDELEQGLLELQDQANLERGLIVATCMPTLASKLLPSVVAAFIGRFPNIKITIHDEIAAPLISRVRDREADFGIGPRIDGSDELDFELLMRDPFIAAFAEDHPLSKCERITLHELISHSLLTLPINTNVRKVIDQAFAGAGLALKPIHEAQHRFTLCGMAEAGLGVALLPQMIMSTVNSNLIMRPIYPNIACDYGVITRRDHAQSPAVEAFLIALRKAIADYAKLTDA